MALCYGYECMMTRKKKLTGKTTSVPQFEYDAMQCDMMQEDGGDEVDER